MMYSEAQTVKFSVTLKTCACSGAAHTAMLRGTSQFLAAAG